MEPSRQLDSLSEAAWKAIRAANALIKYASESADFSEVRFFKSDLDYQLASIAESFPQRAPELTASARAIGPVPVCNGGFSATSAHALAFQVAQDVQAAVRQVRANQPKSWSKCCQYLRSLKVDCEWIGAAIITESDMMQLRRHETSATPAVDVKAEGHRVPTSPSSDSGPDSPMGFLGGAALAKALGIHATRRGAFEKRLERKRMSLGDDCWQEVQDRRPNDPKFLYLMDSPKLRELATGYKTPKPA